MDGRLPGAKGLGQGTSAAAASARHGNAAPKAGAEQPEKPLAHDGDAVEGSPPSPSGRKTSPSGSRRITSCAQRENDPRLLEAVSYLGQGFADKEKAAEILLKLLEGLPPSADSDDDGPAAGRGAGGAQLVEAIVAALAAIDTPSARQAIEQLAAGELEDVRQSCRGGRRRRRAPEPAQPRKRGCAVPRGHAGRRPQPAGHKAGGARTPRGPPCSKRSSPRPPRRSGCGWPST